MSDFVAYKLEHPICTITLAFRAVTPSDYDTGPMM